MASQQQAAEANADNQWQLNYTTIGESIGHYFMNEDGADIWVVPLLNAASPPKKFPAHKFILKTRSPVFYAQFRFEQLKKNQRTEIKGETDEETSNAPEEKKKPMEMSTDGNNQIETIELIDVDPDAFEQFLRFCYTDNAEINVENATSIFYTANRYTLKPLMRKALELIKEHLNLENACEVLQFATQFNFDGVKNLEKCALEIIREKTEEVVKTEAFFEINSDTLQLIVSQDSLAIKEIALFMALIHWGKKKQEDDRNKDKTLRELITPALFHIQFWQMSIWTFGRCVVPTKVLTYEETVYIFEKLSTETEFFSSIYPFATIKNLRGGQYTTHEIIRFGEFAGDLEHSDQSQFVTISGFSFRISADIEQITKDNNKQNHLRISLICLGPQPSFAQENWNCEVAWQLILVTKAPNQKDKIRMFLHRFEKANDWNCWGYLSISVEELLDPANGWIENDSVTVKAKILVIDRGDFDDAKNELCA